MQRLARTDGKETAPVTYSLRRNLRTRSKIVLKMRDSLHRSSGQEMWELSPNCRFEALDGQLVKTSERSSKTKTAVTQTENMSAVAGMGSELVAGTAISIWHTIVTSALIATCVCATLVITIVEFNSEYQKGLNMPNVSIKSDPTLHRLYDKFDNQALNLLKHLHS